MLRLERLWTLANVLAVHGLDVSLSGLRGVRYVNAEVARRRDAGAKYANLDYPLLSRQAPNGALGIYGSVAEELRLIDRANYVLAPDSGERLAEAFIEGTSMPPAVRKAAAGKDEKVSLDTLTTWGKKAGMLAPVTEGEADVFRDALTRDPLRARASQLLVAHRADSFPGELARMAEIRCAVAKGGQHLDIADALDAILTFEAFYRATVLALERLLWLCRTAPPPLGEDRAMTDAIFREAQAAAIGAAARFREALANQRTDHVGKARHRCGRVLAPDVEQQRALLRRQLATAAPVGARRRSQPASPWAR